METIKYGDIVRFRGYDNVASGLFHQGSGLFVSMRTVSLTETGELVVLKRKYYKFVPEEFEPSPLADRIRAALDKMDMEELIGAPRVPYAEWRRQNADLVRKRNREKREAKKAREAGIRLAYAVRDRSSLLDPLTQEAKRDICAAAAEANLAKLERYESLLNKKVTRILKRLLPLWLKRAWSREDYKGSMIPHPGFMLHDPMNPELYTVKVRPDVPYADCLSPDACDNAVSGSSEKDKFDVTRLIELVVMYRGNAERTKARTAAKLTSVDTYADLLERYPEHYHALMAFRGKAEGLADDPKI